jgi:hypothetical protein
MHRSYKLKLLIIKMRYKVQKPRLPHHCRQLIGYLLIALMQCRCASQPRKLAFSGFLRLTFLILRGVFKREGCGQHFALYAKLLVPYAE